MEITEIKQVTLEKATFIEDLYKDYPDMFIQITGREDVKKGGTGKLLLKKKYDIVDTWNLRSYRCTLRTKDKCFAKIRIAQHKDFEGRKWIGYYSYGGMSRSYFFKDKLQTFDEHSLISFFPNIEVAIAIKTIGKDETLAFFPNIQKLIGLEENALIQDFWIDLPVP